MDPSSLQLALLGELANMDKVPSSTSEYRKQLNRSPSFSDWKNVVSDASLQSLLSIYQGSPTSPKGSGSFAKSESGPEMKDVSQTGERLKRDKKIPAWLKDYNVNERCPKPNSVQGNGSRKGLSENFNQAQTSKGLLALPCSPEMPKKWTGQLVMKTEPFSSEPSNLKNQSSSTGQGKQPIVDNFQNRGSSSYEKPSSVPTFSEIPKNQYATPARTTAPKPNFKPNTTPSQVPNWSQNPKNYRATQARSPRPNTIQARSTGRKPNFRPSTPPARNTGTKPDIMPRTPILIRSGTKRKSPEYINNLPLLTSPSSPNADISKKRVDDFFCEICQASCSSSLTLNQHLKGRPHKAKLKWRQEQRNSSEGAGANKGGNLRCDVCGVICSDEMALEMHFKGKKHQSKLENGDGVANKMLRCELCFVNCMNEDLFKMHLVGKSHVRTEMKRRRGLC